ncbi:MAG: DUF2029 domain-containing protein [Microbacteriaceae bacterium]|nr:DUF2029 domain-containing protein [Microbacteriaceae bacterium]
MTDAAPPSAGTRRSAMAWASHPVPLWSAFVLVHFWLGMLGLYGPGLPLGDVTLIYRYWVQNGLDAGLWVGIDLDWVYPILALVPMLAAHVLGPDLYASTWLSMVMLVDAVAFAALTGASRDRRLAIAGWWWLGFLLLLGPVALGRIDSITVPVAIMGVLALASAPRLAAVLLTVATWIKVWPAALIAAAMVALRSRWRIALAAAIASLAIAVVPLALGAGPRILSFIGQQTGRGLQVESIVGTFWMWDAFASHSTRSLVYYDQAILTFQVIGPGTVAAAGITTPLLAIAAAALLALGWFATRRGVPATELLPPLMLALTTALIVFNKVGSPQFVTWLAVPIVLGLVTRLTGRGRSFRTPAVLALVIAGMTQLIYPYLYDQLLGLDFTLLLVLSARNVLYIALLAWAVVAVVDEIRERGDIAAGRMASSRETPV